MPLSYRELVQGLQRLGIPAGKPVIAHASLKAFGEVRGGAETLLGALLSVFPRLMMPTHTYQTMLIPEDGPENNAIRYGSGRDQNAMAVFFSPNLPADALMGVLPETLRKHPQAKRSAHPILSFAGLRVEDALAAQTLNEPLSPIRVLEEAEGWALLLGVDHTVNTSIHYAEKLAGRRQFVRWALTPAGVVECPGFPGCSLGFEKAASLLQAVTRETTLGGAQVRALPLVEMIGLLVAALREDPLAFLCDDPACERCAATRRAALGA